MIALIDTIFNPVIAWLFSIRSYISELSVPLSRPLNITQYLGPFALLGPYWITFISTACVFAFIYIVAFIVMMLQGTYLKFKDSIKWW